jgi:outer membrane protein
MQRTLLRHSQQQHRRSHNNPQMKVFLATIALVCLAPFAMAQTKMAHVNTAMLIDTLPSQKKSSAEIQSIQKSGIDELKEMEASVMKAMNEYRNLPQDSPASVVEYTRAKAQKAQETYEARRQEIGAKLEEMSVALDQRVLKVVKEAIAIVAKKKGLNYVIDMSSALYANGTDITNEVIAELLKLDAQASTGK